MKRFVLLLVLAGCPAPVVSTDGGVEDAGVDGGTVITGEDAGYRTSGRHRLRWKRHRALQNDLAAALELGPDQVCTEIGGRTCATTGPLMLNDMLRAFGAENPEPYCAYLQASPTCRDQPLFDLTTPKGVHALSLGANDPFLGETFEPLREPGVTTPLALDRMVLSACGTRVALDAAGPPKVFTHLDLKSMVVTAESPGLREEFENLYRRLLARDARPDEVDALLELANAEPTLSGAELARLACYAIATTTEGVLQ